MTHPTKPLFLLAIDKLQLGADTTSIFELLHWYELLIMAFLIAGFVLLSQTKNPLVYVKSNMLQLVNKTQVFQKINFKIIALRQFFF